MEFTNYFSMAIKINGAPHLSSDQLSRMMNIVAMEIKIKTLKDLDIQSRTVFSQTEGAKNNLQRLTKGLMPENLLKEMIDLS